MGRPTAATPEIIARYLERLANGEGERQICRDKDMPSRSVFIRLRRDNEDFRGQYARAREDQADSFVDRMMDEADQAVDSDSAAAARVKIDVLKWTAGKLRPKVYGDKIQQEHSGGVSVEIVRFSDPA